LNLELIEKRKKKLKNEIIVAQQELERNLDELSVQKYLPSTHDLLPDLFSNPFSGAGHMLSAIDPFIKVFLPQESKLNATYEILKIIASDHQDDSVQSL
jgi:hypothetical protein